jgi:type IV pilus assembly protein PilQ
LERKQKALQQDLTARGQELAAARDEAKRSAQARQVAEREAERLRAVAVDREREVVRLRAAQDAASRRQLQQAETKLGEARAELEARIGARDRELQVLEGRLTAQLAGTRKELAAAQQDLAKAQAEAKARAAEVQAERLRAERATAQLSQREQELGALKSALQEREAQLEARLQGAIAAERKAATEGRTEDAARAKAERERLTQAQGTLRSDLQAQAQQLAAARTQAKLHEDARKQAELQARKLQESLAARERQLADLQQGTSASADQLDKARKAVDEARGRLAEQAATEAARKRAMVAQFETRLAGLRTDLEQAHARELERVKAERQAATAAAEQRARRVEKLLGERETELKRLQDELKVREVTLAGQLDDAKAREQEAVQKGRAAEAQQAAAERRDLEGAMAKLKADLQGREQALQTAEHEAQQQAAARAQAQQDVARLVKALQEREQALSDLRARGSADDQHARTALQVAEQQVAALRKQHDAAILARDGEIQRLERDLEGRIAQVRAELQAQLRKREAELGEMHAAELASADKAAKAQQDRMTALVDQRERQMQALKAQLQSRIDGLQKALETARRREHTAAQAGHRNEQQAARRDLLLVQREIEASKRELVARDAAIASARKDAERAETARRDAEWKANKLAEALEARAAELATLKSGRAASADKVAEAEKALQAVQKQLAAEKQAQAVSARREEERVQRELADVRKQLEAEHLAQTKALQDRFLAREQELERALVAEQQKRAKAEAVAAGKLPPSSDDYVKRQQTRIAVLEARAERERQEKAALDKVAEQERERTAEVQRQLDRERADREQKERELADAKRAVEDAATKARAAELDAAERKRQAQVRADDEQMRREAESERQKTRMLRTVAEPQETAQVRNVAITAEGKRRGRIELPLTGPAPEARVEVLSRSPERSVLRVTGVKLPDRLQRAFDTRALQGPMERVSAFRPEGTRDELRLVVDLNGRAADLWSWQGGKLVWEFDTDAVASYEVAGQAGGGGAAVRPAGPGQEAGGAGAIGTPQPFLAPQGDPQGGGTGLASPEGAGVQANPIRAPWRKSRRYTGKRINLTIKDADIQHVLTFLAKEGKVNIIAGPDVAGNVTFHLENIPWDLALDVILRARGYDYVRESGVIRVAPAEQLKKEFEAEIERRQKLEDVKQVVVRILPINYGSAQELSAQVKEILSKKGSVTVDLRTNSLIVKDTEEHVAAVEEMIRKLDGQTPQVLIEARIVEASSNFSKDVGIQWGGNFAASSVFGNETGLYFPSVVGVAGGADASAPNKAGVAINVPNYAVNLPAAVGSGSGGAIGLTLGSIGGIANLNLRISAAEVDGIVKLVSSPKVLTLDNQTATIRQGIQIPISVVSAQGVQTRFFNADLQLRTTPHITQDGNVRMEVNIVKAEPDFSNRAADGNPTIASREAQTVLLLGDGETTVIGGIYTRSTSQANKKVPFFADLPLIGFFFRSKSEEDKRNELLIFITPRIVNRAAAMSVGK